jgi:hypothetical protein
MFLIRRDNMIVLTEPEFWLGVGVLSVVALILGLIFRTLKKYTDE